LQKRTSMRLLLLDAFVGVCATDHTHPHQPLVIETTRFDIHPVRWWWNSNPSSSLFVQNGAFSIAPFPPRHMYAIVAQRIPAARPSLVCSPCISSPGAHDPWNNSTHSSLLGLPRQRPACPPPTLRQSFFLPKETGIPTSCGTRDVFWPIAALPAS